RLRDLLPETARLLRGGASRSVPASAVPPGSTIRIRAGERLPLGGKVLEGSAQVDLAAITGEHEPRQAGPGETLPAGAVALDGALDLQVTRVAGNRLLDRVAASLEEARARRTPSMRQAERLTAWLLPAVLLLAGGVLVGQGMFGTWEEGILRALAVLLVSCPCSLGLATPLATWSGIGAALRHGVLVRNGISLEILPRVRTFLFDKTGTLTEGKRRLVNIVGNRSLRGVAAALAGSSAHPAAGALTGKEALPIPEGF
ncbi:MAG: HAD-IC family P-type ATPase, partial [Planctomycetota bacterium]